MWKSDIECAREVQDRYVMPQPTLDHQRPRAKYVSSLEDLFYNEMPPAQVEKEANDLELKSNGSSLASAVTADSIQENLLQNVRIKKLSLSKSKEFKISSKPVKRPLEITKKLAAPLDVAETTLGPVSKEEKPTKFYVCSKCDEKFEKAQQLGGHCSRVHKGMSVSYTKKVEVRNGRPHLRESLRQAKLLVNRSDYDSASQYHKALQSKRRTLMSKL